MSRQYPACVYSKKHPGGILAKSPDELDEGGKYADDGPFFDNPALKEEAAKIKPEDFADNIAAKDAEIIALRKQLADAQAASQVAFEAAAATPAKLAADAAAIASVKAAQAAAEAKAAADAANAKKGNSK